MNQKHNVTVPGLGLTFSTGSIAQLAGGAVNVNVGETNVFVTACVAQTMRPGQDFFPLTCDYRYKYAAAGRFPGGYFKREGRPTEREILISRLCDRPCRPLFPEGFLNEVQIIGQLMSADLIHDSDIAMVNGASAALAISDIPWNGPIGCVRVALIDGQFVANPTIEQMFSSSLDLIYVGNAKDMLMIEGSADQIAEEKFIEALAFGHQVEVVFYDVCEDDAPAREYGIQYIPTQVFLDDKGVELHRHTGFYPQEKIEALLLEHGLTKVATP